MHIKELPITCYKGERVLLTRSITEAYKYTMSGISKIVTRNCEALVEGVHFFKLNVSEARGFHRAYPQLETLCGLRVSIRYLWTQEGARVLMTMLTKPSAQKGYSALEKYYFERASDL